MRLTLRLVVSCTVLGVGVALLLTAGLGSDGYSTMINGLSIGLEVPFWVVNLVVGVVLVGLAWARGLRPGLGTVLQPLVVGFVVSGLLGVLDQPGSWWLRAVLLVAAFPVVAAGVAGYLAADAGAGPTEAAAIAMDPPVPFAWSYSLVQGGGALVGWLGGAAVGPGTLLVIALLGPLVDLLARRFAMLRAPGATPRP
ncbi:MAG: hypothetical protein Q7T56_15135 [Nocardioidaceae bacterium]|nr:hypothetical protein [Nocardioidaceae bacterium]